MQYVLQVNSSPCQSAAGMSALNFVNAAIANQHQILRIFFYGDGIYHALRFTTPPNDEYDISPEWRQLAQQHNIDLVVCISSAQRRGLLSSNEAARQQKKGDDLAEGFRISGLGQLMDAIMQADRFIAFG